MKSKERCDPQQLKEHIQLDLFYLQLSHGEINRKQSSIIVRKHQKTQISTNKRFMAVQQDNNKINIWNNKKFKIINSIRFKLDIIEFQFSRDNDRLLVTNRDELIIKPFLNCIQTIPFQYKFDDKYPISKNLKQYDNQIIFSLGCRIISINTINHKMNNMIKIFTEILFFDYSPQLNILICGYSGTLITFQDNKLLFKQNCQYSIYMVYFYGNQNNIIAFSKENCIIMFIDQKNEQFNQITKINFYLNDFYFNLDLFPDFLIFLQQNKCISAYTLLENKYKQRKEFQQLSILKQINIKAQTAIYRYKSQIIESIK